MSERPQRQSHATGADEISQVVQQTASAENVIETALPREEPFGLLQRVNAWRKSRVGRVVMASVALLAVGLSGTFVFIRLRDSLVPLASMAVSLRWGDAFISLGCTFLCVLMGGVIWRQMLRGVGQDLNWSACMRGHLLANLGGYLPGYGWKFVGKAVLAQRAGVPASWVSLAVLIEFTGLALTRLVIALWALPFELLAIFGLSVGSGVLWLARVLALALLVVSPWIIGWLVRRARTREKMRALTVRPFALLSGLGLMCLTWLLYGLGFVFLARAVYPIEMIQVGPLVFSTTTSFLVSLLMFFVPAGLGVRESVVILTLEGILPVGIVTLIALLNRLILIIAEVLGALLGSGIALRERLCK